MMKKMLCSFLVMLSVFAVGNCKTEVYAKTVETKSKEAQSVINEKSSFSFTGVKLSKTSGVKSGDTVTVSPVVSGDSGVTYKYVWGRDNWTDWKTVKGFSSAKQVSVQVGKAGKYEFYIDAKDKNGKVISKKATITVKPAFDATGISGGSSVVAGDKLTLKPIISGSTANLTYKFVWERNNWNPWGIAQQYAANNVYGFASNKTGQYNLYIDVKDKWGNVDTVSKKVSVINPYTVNGINVSNISLGQTAVISADVSGDTGLVSYKFVWGKNNWQQWGTLKGFNGVNNTTFKPSAAGTYDIYMDVMDRYGNITTVSKKLIVNKNYKINGINVNNISLGQTAKISADVSGETGGLKYKFVWGKNNWQQWGTLRAFSNVNNTTFKPNAAGTYDIYMDVMDKYGDVTTVSKKFTVTNTLTVKAPTVSNTKVGVPVTVKANASSTVGGLKYKFVWEKNNWKQWGVLGTNGFSSAASATFDPKAGPGTYNIYTDVMDNSGNVITKSKSITVSNYSASVSVDVASVDQGKPVNITVKGVPKNTELKYVACYDNWTKWELIKQSTTNTSMTFRPKYTGNLTIYVDTTYYGVVTTFTSRSIKVSQGAQLVSEFLQLVNTERAKGGLSPLKWDNSIDDGVLVRAKELATLFDHTRPDGSSCFTAGNFYGEIIAAGQGSPQRAVEAWMNSPGHRGLIMLPEFTSMSGARFGNYWIICFSYK